VWFSSAGKEREWSVLDRELSACERGVALSEQGRLLFYGLGLVLEVWPADENA
jgi:hypothetical protein